MVYGAASALVAEKLVAGNEVDWPGERPKFGTKRSSTGSILSSLFFSFDA